jgi:ATP-binding cassette, subfamily B, bacterial
MSDGHATRLLLRRFLWPYRWPMATSACLAVAGTVVKLAQPWPLLLVVDNAIGHRPLPGMVAGVLGPLQGRPVALAAVAAGLEVGLYTLSAVIDYLTTYLTGAASERIGADLRAAVHAQLLRLSLRFHDGRRTGDLVTRLTGDVSRVEDALVAWLATLLPELLTVVGMLALLIAIDPLMAVTGVATVPLLATVAMVRRRAVRPAQGEAREQQGLLASHLTEVLRNVRAVQAFAQEPETLRRFVVRNREATRSNLVALDVSARYAPIADIVLALGSGMVLLLGVVRVTSGRMTVGVMLVVLSYLADLYSPIRTLTRLSSTLAKRAASQERILEVLGSAEVVPEHRRPLPLVAVEHAITFEKVRFAYQAGAPVLRDLSLSIPAGTTLAIVGPTGVGKSTLLSLLLRLYDPDAGVVRIDDVDLRRFRLASLRERIALVPQEPWIMDGSIRDNVVFGCPGAGDDEVMAAARLALVDEFASRLPLAYDTPVGEGGVLLSGGQRRRLAIARALLRDAAILLLDEPTTGLDAEAEAEVMEAIRRAGRGRTVVLVTHSLRLAAVADRIAVLRDGAIVEQGTPAELAALKGIFQHLQELQQPSMGRAPAADTNGDGATNGSHSAGTRSRRSISSQGRR